MSYYTRNPQSARIFKYFAGTTQLTDVYYTNPAKLSPREVARGLDTPPPARMHRYGQAPCGTHPETGRLTWVTRSIEYSRTPSRHKCGSRCMNARGPSCECSCGGANHGRGTFG